MDLLSSLEWKDIYKEKFHLTPISCFDEMVCMAESLVARQDAASQRRRQWLNEIDAYDEEVEENSPVQVCGRRVDKYGIDLEVFKNKTGKKPHSWRLFLICFVQ